MLFKMHGIANQTQTVQSDLEVERLPRTASAAALWEPQTYAHVALLSPLANGAQRYHLAALQDVSGAAQTCTAWTPDQLRWMTSLRQTGNTEKGPVAFARPTALLVNDLITKLAHVIAQQIGKMRQRPPAPAPQTPTRLAQLTPSRVRFMNELTADRERPILNFSPSPKPLTHPALVRY